MASTLIQRICAPDHTIGQVKLSIHGVVGVAQEIAAGRMPANAMGAWLTAEEQVDANAIMALIPGTFSYHDVKSILMLGELEIYPVATIEQIFGL